MSSAPVLQQPSRKNPVRGADEQTASGPPNTFLSGVVIRVLRGSAQF
jgi:hypothetical protein